MNSADLCSLAQGLACDCRAQDNQACCAPYLTGQPQAADCPDRRVRRSYRQRRSGYRSSAPQDCIVVVDRSRIAPHNAASRPCVVDLDYGRGDQGAHKHRYRPYLHLFHPHQTGDHQAHCFYCRADCQLCIDGRSPEDEGGARGPAGRCSCD